MFKPEANLFEPSDRKIVNNSLNNIQSRSITKCSEIILSRRKPREIEASLNDGTLNEENYARPAADDKRGSDICGAFRRLPNTSVTGGSLVSC